MVQSYSARIGNITFCDLLRHLWFVLGRYLHQVALDDILIETFFRRARSSEPFHHKRRRCTIQGILLSAGSIALCLPVIHNGLTFRNDPMQFLLPLGPRRTKIPSTPVHIIATYTIPFSQPMSRSHSRWFYVGVQSYRQTCANYR